MEHGAVAGAATLGPETQLQRGDRIDVGVDARQHYALVVAIGAGGSSVVPIQAAAATRGVVVGAATAHIGVAEILRAVVQTAPAVNPCMVVAATRGDTFIGLKAHGIRQTVEIVALRADGAVDVFAHAGAALCGHSIGILRIGSQPSDGIRVVGNIICGVAIEDDTVTASAAGIPTNGDFVDSGAGRHIGWWIAPIVGQEDIVDGHIGSRRRPRALDGNKVAIARIAG